MSVVGLSLNRRHYPSGVLMAMVGLVVIFLTLGFVVKEFA